MQVLSFHWIASKMNSAWYEGEETRNGIIWDGQNPGGGGITKQGRGSAVREGKEQEQNSAGNALVRKAKRSTLGRGIDVFLPTVEF